MPSKLKNFVADFVKFSFFGFQQGFCSITNPRLLLLEYPTACPVLLVFFLSFALLEERLLRLFPLCEIFCFFLNCFVYRGGLRLFCILRNYYPCLQVFVA